MKVLILIYTMVLSISSEEIVGDINSLEVLHVVFRHGDRTPDRLYPKDPFTEETFYPIRIGELTNKGKMTEFQIGKTLRKKYHSFLPKVYTPEILNAISSHMPRSRASLELVLAGLFPPARQLRWNPNLLWEPIPYEYLEKSKNQLFLTAESCPNYQNIEKNVMMDYRNPYAEKYGYLLPRLRETTGLNETDILSMGWGLYSILKSEEEWGLTLPEWTKGIYPDVVRELSEQYWVFISQGDLKALTSGYLISRILNNTECTIKEESCNRTKIYLYSGHDTNIAGILAFLDNFKPHNPTYGAYIVIEIHNILGVRHLKFLHQNYQNKEPDELVIPNCGVYCPLEKFKEMYSEDIDIERLNKLCGI